VEPQDPMPMQPPRRRRRPRRKKTLGERMLELAKGGVPLLLVGALALLTAGVVHVVEHGAAFGANRRGDALRPYMATVRPVDATNAVLRPLDRPMRNDAIRFLNEPSTAASNPKIKTATPTMQDQILDSGLLEDARKLARADKARDDAIEQQLGALLDEDPDLTAPMSP
jgi:hypothetical protein